MGRNVGGVGKCVGVWESVLRVWGNVFGYEGRCREMLGEMWGCGEVYWGVGGGVEKCWGDVGKCWGKCGKVCWGVEKVRGDVGRSVGCVGKCVEVWRKV